MLHFKNDALARRQSFHRCRQPCLNLFPRKVPLGIERGTILPLAFEEVRAPILILRRVQFRSLILRSCLAAAQVIQAYVGYDAVEPGVKAALETEAVEIAVDLK